jgi:hypothetical protein
MAIPPLDTCCVVGVHEQAAEAASTGASARIHVAGWSDPHLCFLDPGSLPRPRFAHPTTTCLVDRQFTGSAPWLSQNDSSEEVGTSLARAPQFRSATVRAHTPDGARNSPWPRPPQPMSTATSSPRRADLPHRLSPRMCSCVTHFAGGSHDGCNRGFGRTPHQSLTKEWMR